MGLQKDEVKVQRSDFVKCFWRYDAGWCAPVVVDVEQQQDIEQQQDME
jgi:hypothetical protein